MKELVEIIRAYDQAQKNAMQSVLATVVHVDGSSYRRPGARMLVLENGLMIGAISGGCLEGDALKKALLTFSDQTTRLITYDTSNEDDATLGIQLGCEGVIQVLFEYINHTQQNNPIELLRKACNNRQKSVLVTLFDVQDKKNPLMGTTCLLDEQENFESTLETEINNSMLTDARLVLTNAKAQFSQYKTGKQSIHAFLDYIQPPISIVIVGAGNDAIPLSQMADLLGWEVKVVDGRNTHAKQDRFISACQVLVSRPEKVLDQIKIDDRTCFVLMTHNYQYDLQMLKALLPLGISYIGLLGPKKKLEKALNELSEQGFVPTEAQLASVYGPTGLDIGAETAEEIASSIIAEIQAVFNNKEGYKLKLKSTQIHQ
jgi:xanthine/CO dehydrogenase XdhC/CoxF family maturation factor